MNVFKSYQKAETKSFGCRCSSPADSSAVTELVLYNNFEHLRQQKYRLSFSHRSASGGQRHGRREKDLNCFCYAQNIFGLDLRVKGGKVQLSCPAIFHFNEHSNVSEKLKGCYI